MDVKILVVDDSIFMRRIIKKVLASYGYTQVLEAQNGLEGVRKFRLYTPDLVLLDIMMPGIDGVETLKRIMSIDRNAKVVMLTAVGQEVTMKECSELGAVDYITKPFEGERVATTLRKTLGSSKNVR